MLLAVDPGRLGRTSVSHLDISISLGALRVGRLPPKRAIRVLRPAGVAGRGMAMTSHAGRLRRLSVDLGYVFLGIIAQLVVAYI
ncbi:hypothetical protein [Kibdelosporangium philippinense]|uniref:hypothetical protein n=1 Tax=Kibdelosporangium philippinense TaxID=211113 RepID=UPI003620134D